MMLGGVLGVIGAVAGFAVPGLVAYVGPVPGGPIDPATIDLAALEAAALLYLLSLTAYRSAFRALRSADRRFRIASTFCLVGSLGLLLVLAAGAYLSGSASAFAQCVQGNPSAGLACVRSHALTGPVGGSAAFELATAGLLLAAVGSLGIVGGLAWEARRIGSSALGVGAALYAIGLLLLAGPLAGVALAVPALSESILALPFLGIAAPGLVIAGTFR